MSKETNLKYDVPCDYCGKIFKVTGQRLRNNKTHCCSRECAANLKKENAIPNCNCAICGKPLHRKPSEFKRNKNQTCSPECLTELRKMQMTGKNNHQYGLKGELNSTFKNGKTITHYGYYKVLNHNHPFKDVDNRVFEHRLVAEEYLLDEINSIRVGESLYLSDDYTVHHIDFDRLNNNVENLAVMTKSDHSRFHNLVDEIKRDELGRFVEKQKADTLYSKDELKEKFYDFVKQTKCYCNMLHVN